MQGGRTMGEYSEAFVAFDVAKTRHAVAIADGGRGSEVRFLGEVASSAGAVDRLIGKLAGRYGKLHFCYGGHSGAPVSVPRNSTDPAARRCTVALTGGPAMHFIGIDVSTKESALCILDSNGKIVRETKLPSDPEIIARFIAD